MTPEIAKAKAEILKKRRQRIRRETYAYVAQAIVEDTAQDVPFRDRLVIDWWARVVDPLEAERYDQERLRYFRERLREHYAAPSANAAIRQGQSTGNQLRRLLPEKLAYVQHQVRRMADRKINYAAAKRAIEENDSAYEQLTIGLFLLPAIRPGSNDSLLGDAARAATGDPRFGSLMDRLRKDREILLPGLTQTALDRRVQLLSNPFDEGWYVSPSSSYVEERGRQKLIRKIEDYYISENR